MATRDDHNRSLLEAIELQLRRIALALEKPETNHSTCKCCGFSRLNETQETCPVCRTPT